MRSRCRGRARGFPPPRTCAAQLVIAALRARWPPNNAGPIDTHQGGQQGCWCRPPASGSRRRRRPARSRPAPSRAWRGSAWRRGRAARCLMQKGAVLSVFEQARRVLVPRADGGDGGRADAPAARKQLIDAAARLLVRADRVQRLVHHERERRGRIDRPAGHGSSGGQVRGRHPPLRLASSRGTPSTVTCPAAGPALDLLAPVPVAREEPRKSTI